MGVIGSAHLQSKMGINNAAHELLLCGVYNYFTMAALMDQQQ